jgi:hypothetical protein
MYCAGCGSPADGRGEPCPWCGSVAFYAPVPAPPVAAPPAGGAGFALLVDGVCCAAVFVGGLALAAAIATGRGAHGLHAVTVRLGWLHLLLAAAVLVAYRLGAQLFGGRTLGRILADRTTTGRARARLLVPAVATTALLGAFVGVTAPVYAEERPRGYGAPATRSPTPIPTPTSTPTPPPDGRTQAIGVDTLLNASGDSRTSLRAALADAERCVNAAGAAATLQRVTDERSGQLDRARELPVDSIAGGAAIRNRLVEALTHSVAADRAFTAWASNVAAGRCGHDANYSEAGRASSSATAAKRAFCAAWNPVAVGYGLPTRAEADV